MISYSPLLSGPTVEHSYGAQQSASPLQSSSFGKQTGGSTTGGLHTVSTHVRGGRIRRNVQGHRSAETTRNNRRQYNPPVRDVSTCLDFQTLTIMRPEVLDAATQVYAYYVPPSLLQTKIGPPTHPTDQMTKPNSSPLLVPSRTHANSSQQSPSVAQEASFSVKHGGSMTSGLHKPESSHTNSSQHSVSMSQPPPLGEQSLGGTHTVTAWRTSSKQVRPDDFKGEIVKKRATARTTTL